MARRSTGIHERTTLGGEEVTLVKAGVLVETTGRRRDRWFAYQVYLDKLWVGTDLDPGHGAG